MQIEWNWKTIAIVAGAALVLVGTNVGQYFVIWKPHDASIQAKYTKEVSTLQNTLTKLGPMTGVWAVKQGNSQTFPGKQITNEDLEIKQIPLSFINDSYVLDPSEIVGKYFKVALTPGAPLLQDLVMSDPLDDTTREYDVVASLLPIGLQVGDYVDFRLVYPLGEDYIVLAHKRIEAINAKTVKFRMNETEIHMYQGAVVDYYIQMQKGAQLYMAKYIEPGSQKAAGQYYAVPKNILAIITADPNVLTKINAQINNGTRGIIDAGVKAVTDDIGASVNAGRNDVKSKVDQGATEEQNARKKAEEAMGVTNPGAQPTTGVPAPVTPPAPAPATPPKQQPDPTVNQPIPTTPAAPTVPSGPLNIDKGVVH
jgi:hypothetical protein